MSIAAIILAVISLAITWGGFGICLHIALGNKKDSN